MFPRLWASLFGNRGERLAAKTLTAKGYRILLRNCRNRFGEIDLIALDADTIVFVEVKTRSQVHHGRPEDAMTRGKQRSLSRAALAWLHKNRLHDRRCRFDVVAILWREGQEPIIEHYQSAFDATQ